MADLLLRTTRSPGLSRLFLMLIIADLCEPQANGRGIETISLHRGHGGFRSQFDESWIAQVARVCIPPRDKLSCVKWLLLDFWQFETQCHDPCRDQVDRQPMAQCLICQRTPMVHQYPKLHHGLQRLSHNFLSSYLPAAESSCTASLSLDVRRTFDSTGSSLSDKSRPSLEFLNASRATVR